MLNKHLFHNKAVTLSKFIESKGKHIINSKHVYRKITSAGGQSPTYGTEMIFYVPKLGKMNLKDIFLRVDVPAVSGYSGGAYVRFVNNLIIRMFSRFELWSSGQMILQRYPDEIFYNMLPNIKYEQWQYLKTLIGNEDNTTTRNTNAASVQNLMIPLKYIFDIFQKPFPIYLLQDEQKALELRFVLVNHQDKIVQTDHTTKGTTNITDMFLEATYSKNDVIANVQIENAKENLKKHGIAQQFYTHHYHRQSHPVSASASVNQIPQIRQFQDKSLINIIFLVRDTADLSTSYLYDYDDDLKAVTNYQLKDGSNNLYYKESQITDVEYRKYLLPQYRFCGVDKIFDKNVYYFYFGEDASKEFNHENVKDYQGARAFHLFNDLKIDINLASTSSAKTIDIIATEAKRLGIIKGCLKKLN